MTIDPRGSLCPIHPYPAAQGALYLEVPVVEDLRPYMVSGTQGFVWVPKAGRPFARTALRQWGSASDLYRDVVEEIYNVSLSHGWGQIHPLTADGVRDAIGHVGHYGYPTDILIPPALADSGLVDLSIAMVAEWLPEDLVLILPADRTLVGYAHQANGRYAVTIFDPSRAFGFASARVMVDRSLAESDVMPLD